MRRPAAIVRVTFLHCRSKPNGSASTRLPRQHLMRGASTAHSVLDDSTYKRPKKPDENANGVFESGSSPGASRHERLDAPGLDPDSNTPFAFSSGFFGRLYVESSSTECAVDAPLLRYVAGGMLRLIRSAWSGSGGTSPSRLLQGVA